MENDSCKMKMENENVKWTMKYEIERLINEKWKWLAKILQPGGGVDLQARCRNVEMGVGGRGPKGPHLDHRLVIPFSYFWLWNRYPNNKND